VGSINPFAVGFILLTWAFFLLSYGKVATGVYSYSGAMSPTPYISPHAATNLMTAGGAMIFVTALAGLVILRILISL
jgi:hydroxyacyl-ACP dehydratase HTD2-like protein with hotdog domain